VPREFIPRSQYGTLEFPILSAGPEKFRRVRISSRVVLDAVKPEENHQRKAFADMRDASSGILNLSCGLGKTVIALHHMAHKKVPALVIVNNTTLIDQWRERISQFLDVEDGVGVVQGPPSQWDWEGRGIVLAMLHSLSLRYEELPPGFDRYFGSIYYDEVHHLSAPLFSHTAPLFYGNRYGLTATVQREDGLEPVYQYHIGPVFHRNLSQELRPKIYFQEVPVQINVNAPEVRSQIYDARGMLNIPKLRTYLGLLPENNEFISAKIKEAVKSNRKILVLSHSVDQLRELCSKFKDAGLCTGREAPSFRIHTLRTKQVTFGTLQLVREALDERTLDTLFFLTPFGSSAIDIGGKNTLQQGMGRILRYHTEKKTPVVVIFDHIYVPKFHKMCRKLKQLLHTWPRDEGGPFEYTLVKPYDRQGVK
jgi:superfamily II DNA or RNA helicase